MILMVLATMVMIHMLMHQWMSFQETSDTVSIAAADLSSASTDISSEEKAKMEVKEKKKVPKNEREDRL